MTVQQLPALAAACLFVAWLWCVLTDAVRYEAGTRLNARHQHCGWDLWSAAHDDLPTRAVVAVLYWLRARHERLEVTLNDDRVVPVTALRIAWWLVARPARFFR